MGVPTDKIFLRAEWRQLAMLNYEIEPEVLAPFVPRGVELDSFNKKTFVSMVGFLFLNSRVWGVPFPLHRNFEEVNLRFYVRRKADDGWRRGVVFIRELVPRPFVAFIARRVYNEPYLALPMEHRVGKNSAEYSWRFAGRDNWLRVVTGGEPQKLPAGSEAEFITEHYWGYTRQRDGSTMEYRVEHPRWRFTEAADAQLKCDIAGLYGAPFVEPLSRKPTSAFIAEGSAVTVSYGARLRS